MNQVFTHPAQPEMQVEVILASQGPDQKPIYTIRMRYPRIIHGEIMTHRVFSRNARSSRAVPVKTMLEEIRTRPFVPWHWGKNQKGMQAGAQAEARIIDHTRCVYMQARDNALSAAFELSRFDLHKQIVNRLLEPFSWIDMLITSTDWSNFLWLRDHKDAEPHLQDLARLVRQVIDEAEIQKLEPGQWHLPYIEESDFAYASKMFGAGYDWHTATQTAFLRKISAARCARISYKPFDGDSSYEKELARYDMLVTSDRVHASPTEHQATPDVQNTWDGLCNWAHPHLHGNLDGYVQARKLIPNERA